MAKRKRPVNQELEQFHEMPKRFRLNDSQQNAWYLFQNLPIVCLEGDAGTGKSWCALAWGKQAIESGLVEKIIYVRSPLEMGRSRMGALPGTSNEKMAPYLAPLQAIAKDLGIHPDLIEAYPLPYIQGMTFSNSFVILDEAQNLSIEEFRALVTRLGKDSRLAIIGDCAQDTRGMGGYPIFLKAVNGLPSVGIQHFNASDNMRHPVIVEVLTALKGL
jgi:phosphate starvation-inducible PhoH-like protein